VLKGKDKKTKKWKGTLYLSHKAKREHVLILCKAILVILQRLKNGTQWEHTVVLCKKG
jgi:hypothetical protein